MLHLPDELLQHILSFLHQSEDLEASGRDNAPHIRTLLSVCLANRRFSNLGYQALYHTINVTWDCGSRRLNLLLRTLRQCPKYRRLVMSLVVSGWDTESRADDRRLRSGAVSNEFSELHDQVLGQLVLPPDLLDRLKTWLPHGHRDAQVAILMFMCSKLRRLALALPYFDDQAPMCVSVFAAAAYFQTESQVNPSHETRSALVWSRLEEIELAHCDTESATDLSGLTCFMQAPSLSTFRLTQIDSCDIRVPGIRCAAKSIFFDDSLVDAEGLKSLLEASQELRVLSIKWGGGWIGDAHIDLTAIGDALREHGLGLTSLKLNTEEPCEGDDLTEGYLGSLTALPLEHLVAPTRALFVRDISRLQYPFREGPAAPMRDPAFPDDANWLVNTIPRSLKTLRISEASDDKDLKLHDAQVLELLHHPSFERLDRVIICRQQPFSHQLDGSMWQVSTKRGSEGVIGSFLTWHYFERQR